MQEKLNDHDEWGHEAAEVSCSLSAAGLAEALITGGLPPAIDEHCGADTVYNATYARVYNQNLKFYQRFPEDIAKVKAIVKLLHEAPGGGVETPGGNFLRPRSLQMLGMSSASLCTRFEHLLHCRSVVSATDGMLLIPRTPAVMPLITIHLLCPTAESVALVWQLLLRKT